MLTYKLCPPKIQLANTPERYTKTNNGLGRPFNVYLPNVTRTDLHQSRS